MPAENDAANKTTVKSRCRK